MNVRYVSHLLTMVPLVAVLAACTGVRSPITVPEATMPIATTESTATVASEAAPEAVTEVPPEEPLSEGPSEESAETQAPGAERIAVEALEPAECEAIQMTVSERLSVEFQTSEMDFASEIANPSVRPVSLLPWERVKILVIS